MMKTIIKNGLIYDGSLNEPFKGDVLFEDDLIVKVAEQIDDEADVTIDAKGLMVCPGLIDAHSHNDFFCERENSEKYFKPFLQQGITTQITGNCSFSAFGADPDTPYADKMDGGLFGSITPGSFADFKKRVEGKLHVNIVPLIGQGSIRSAMSGYDPTPFTKEQIEKELSYVTEAMEGGAFGGSFGFMYEPNRYAKEDEIIAFAKEIAKYDGIITIHPRACSKISADYPLFTKKSHLELGLDEAIDIMKKSGCKLEYSHLIFTGKSSWPLKDKMLSIFHKEKAAGNKIAFDNYAFHYGASVITIVYPEWYAALSKEDATKPINKFKLSLTILMYRKLLGIDWEDLMVAYISDDHPEYEGRTIDEIAKSEGLSPLDAYLKLVDLSNRSGSLYLDKYYNDDIVKTLMEDDLSIFMTDAWVVEKGLQNIATFQTFPQFFLLAKRYGIPFEKIVHKMTGATVERYGIKERGYLKEGYKADITIIDSNKLSVNEKKPDATPGGIEYVFVNGQPVIKESKYIGGQNGVVVLKK